MLVDSLDLDERRTSVIRAGHGPHGGCNRDPAFALQKRALPRIGLAVDQREHRVATEDHPAFPRETVGQASRERSDARDRGNAERNASDEHIEAAQTAPQLA